MAKHNRIYVRKKMNKLRHLKLLTIFKAGRQEFKYTVLMLLVVNTADFCKTSAKNYSRTSN